MDFSVLKRHFFLLLIFNRFFFPNARLARVTGSRTRRILDGPVVRLDGSLDDLPERRVSNGRKLFFIIASPYLLYSSIIYIYKSIFFTFARLNYVRRCANGTDRTRARGLRDRRERKKSKRIRDRFR